MKMNPITALLVGVNALALAVLAGQSATAHDANVYFNAKWPVDANVNYTFDDDTPQSWREPIRQAFGAWSDRVGGRAPRFIPQGEAELGDATTPCNGLNGVFMASTTQVAYVRRCSVGGDGQVLNGFTMVFDPNGATTGWYTGNGDVPSNQLDLQSVATHEAGHATGFGVAAGNDHLDTPCDGADRPTMCEGQPTVDKGRKLLRTLEPHDTHTLEGAYGVPPS